MTRTAIGVDIGGTRLSVGLVSDQGKVLELLREATPPDGEAALALVLEMTAKVMYASDPATWGQAPNRPQRYWIPSSPVVGSVPVPMLPVAIGIGFGGPVDYEAQTIVRSHHVAGWPAGLKLAALFEEELGLPARLDNDANCGGLGEVVFGAAKGRQNVLYVNVGTGIGGAVILNGRVHHGAHSTAGEIGHTVVLPDGPLCTCDKRGCLEALSSGSALGREGRAVEVDDVTGRQVGERALAGDPVARKVIEQAATWLGVALGNAANLIDPEMIVIGGGVSDLGDLYLNPARAAFAATAMPAARDTPIVKAAFGYDAGVIGAAALGL